MTIEQIKFESLIEMVMNGEIADAKTQLALLKAKLYLDKKA